MFPIEVGWEFLPSYSVLLPLLYFADIYQFSDIFNGELLTSDSLIRGLSEAKGPALVEGGRLASSYGRTQGLQAGQEGEAWKMRLR